MHIFRTDAPAASREVRPLVLADHIYELASLTSLYLLYVWLRAIC
jgi:hypothetical protein